MIYHREIRCPMNTEKSVNLYLLQHSLKLRQSDRKSQFGISGNGRVKLHHELLSQLVDKVTGTDDLTIIFREFRIQNRWENFWLQFFHVIFEKILKAQNRSAKLITNIDFLTIKESILTLQQVYRRYSTAVNLGVWRSGGTFLVPVGWRPAPDLPPSRKMSC